ncbi:hypothetical protein ACR2V7_25645, partial [Klebsiella pneumoniae]
QLHTQIPLSLSCSELSVKSNRYGFCFNGYVINPQGTTKPTDLWGLAQAIATEAIKQACVFELKIKSY